VLPLIVHVKSGGGVTVIEKVVVLLAAGALVAPCTVTVDVACGVFVAALTVSVTVTGLAAVGCTVLEGKKLHAAFAGSALQLSVTGTPNDPEAVTWNVAVELKPCGTETGFGLTAPTA
jgi:hypothetical protein